MSKFECPDCGSENAVSKSAAWDALTEIPPKVRDDLDRLTNIEAMAIGLISNSPKAPDEQTVTVSVRKDLLERLAKATGLQL